MSILIDWAVGQESPRCMEIRAEKSSLTEDAIMGCAERAHENNGDLYDVGLGARDRGLYAYLFPTS